MKWLCCSQECSCALERNKVVLNIIIDYRLNFITLSNLLSVHRVKTLCRYQAKHALIIVIQHSLAMFLFQGCYGIAFIQVLILSAKLPSLFGEYIKRDTRANYDDSQIKADEIIRRHTLIEPLLLQIAEKQKDWIETYHMTFGSHESFPRKKVASSSNDIMKDPIQNEISSLDSNEEILKQDKFSDYSGKSVVPEILSLDPEIVHRLIIVEDYIPKLKNLEMGIGLDDADSTVMGNGASSINSMGAMYIDLNHETKRHPEKFISASRFTDTSTQELTVMNKHKTQSDYPPSYSNRQDKDFMLRENIKFTGSKRESTDFNLKKNLESYIASLDKGKENWRETFDFYFEKDHSEGNFKYAPVTEDNEYFSDNPNEVSKCITNVKCVGMQEQPWLKKLLNKLIGDPYTEYVYPYTEYMLPLLFYLPQIF